MEITQTAQSVRALVEERSRFITRSNGRDPYVLFCTVSPNPATLVDITKGDTVMKARYDRIPQRVQYAYCLKHVKTTYLELCSDPIMVGTVELNAHGDVHFHFLLMDRHVCNDVLIKRFQRDVSLCPTSLENLHNKTARDYMNNIVHLTKPMNEIIDYMDKDHSLETREFLPNYYSHPTKMGLPVMPI